MHSIEKRALRFLVDRVILLALALFMIFLVRSLCLPTLGWIMLASASIIQQKSLLSRPIWIWLRNIFRLLFFFSRSYATAGIHLASKAAAASRSTFAPSFSISTKFPEISTPALLIHKHLLRVFKGI